MAYYWRVNATNASGTSPYSAVWSFITEAASPPPAPMLASPQNGATGISTNPTLNWNAASGAASYRLQVSTDASFTTTVFDQSSITNTSQAVTGLVNNTPYYWRVNATNAIGTSPYSAVWSFTTIVATPSAPTLASPSDGATGIATSPTLRWNASDGATSYRLQVSTNPSFTTIAFDQSLITSTSQVVTGLTNSRLYYWRVNATNAGGTSPYSPAWSFTTEAGSSPAAPTLASPLDGATGIAT
ncbi:MAG: fibronectin type III domain-containing protein, partial [Bacteroidota bacterium]